VLVNSSHRFNDQGFTILELLVATSVFTIVLLVVAVGAVSFTNSYYKGIASSKTQAADRNIIASLAQSIQFGKSLVPVSSGSVAGFCIDNTLYAYVVGQQVTDSAPQVAKHQAYHGLVQSIGGSCSAGIPANIAAALGAPGSINLPAGARELLGQRMRISALTISQVGSLYTVHARVMYGDDDLFIPVIGAVPSWSQELCAGKSGSQFCAVSDLTTTVQQRLL
jgi:prepilin-type N-terminal cleavage/methylation domain-containing protein